MKGDDPRSSGDSLHRSADSEETHTRLHITPFDPELLKVVLPSSVAQAARNISFHTIETFPEKRYGFVDLPHMEAEKLKKKLNGVTLKGTKVRIEKARPEERDQQLDDTTAEVKERKKKRKRGIDVLEGVKLEDRKVKRGWTETPEEASKKKKRTRSSKDKDKDKEKDKTEDGEKKKQKSERKRIKSKYTEEAECLLNTKMPPNALKNLHPSDSTRRRKKDKSRQVVIHEFEKTTKFPSFLKNTASAEDSSAAAAEFVEGKGWVDAEGNVVEEVKVKPKPTKTDKKKKVAAKRPVSPEPVAAVVDEDSDDTSSSGSSSEEEEDDTSASSDAESSRSVASPTAPEQSTPNGHASAEKARPMSSSSSRSLTIKIPPPITPSSTKVHPLEALYKRSKPDETATETPAQEQPFSFFGGGGEDDEDVPSSQPAMPMTPYTRQDFEWRNVRSAAPTPDTAHPSRVRNFWATSNEEEEQPVAFQTPGVEDDPDEVPEEEEEDVPMGSNPATSATGSKSEFQDWFWENRRDLNRSWMKRRKASAKEKRHRDNKARASRVF